MSDNPTPVKEEKETIMQWLCKGFVSGSIFVLKAVTLVGLFILVSQYPTESKDYAVAAATGIRDVALWSMDTVSDLVHSLQANSNDP